MPHSSNIPSLSELDKVRAYAKEQLKAYLNKETSEEKTIFIKLSFLSISEYYQRLAKTTVQEEEASTYALMAGIFSNYHNLIKATADADSLEKAHSARPSWLTARFSKTSDRKLATHIVRSGGASNLDDAYIKLNSEQKQNRERVLQAPMPVPHRAWLNGRVSPKFRREPQL